MNSLFYFEILFVKNKLAGDVSFSFVLFICSIYMFYLYVFYIAFTIYMRQIQCPSESSLVPVSEAPASMQSQDEDMHFQAYSDLL